MRVGHAAILCVGILLPSLAQGQSNTYSAVLDTSTGYSDNVNLAASDAAPGEEIAISDGFVFITPQLLVQRDSRRSIHRLSYTFNAQIFFQNAEANSYTNQLDWQTQLLLSRRTRAGFNVSLAQGETNNFQLVNPAGGVQANQAGGVSFVTAVLGQEWSFDQNRNWSFEENFNLQTFLPTDGNATDSFDLSLTAQAERSWERTSIAMQMFSNFLFVIGDGGQQQLLLGPQLLLRRDFLDSWNFELGAGGVAVFNPTDLETAGVTVQPVGSATIRYRKLRSQIELSVLHEVAPNIQVGDVFINDTANLNVNFVILQRPAVFVQGSLGALSAREISTVDNNIGAASLVYFADAALGWQLNRNIELSARYNYQKQDADVNSTLQSFTAHTGFITVTGRYPGSNVERRSNLRRSFRVDGSDTEDAFGSTDRRESIRRPESSR